MFCNWVPDILDLPHAADSGGINDPQPLAPNAESNIKENLNLTGRFLVTVLKKLPDLLEPNPAKLALGIAKAIAEAKDVSHSFDVQVID